MPFCRIRCDFDRGCCFAFDGRETIYPALNAIGLIEHFAEKYPLSAKTGTAQGTAVRRPPKSSRLRLDAASGISALSGDVAEWLKAAVC
jgi:hypothetical protein